MMYTVKMKKGKRRLLNNTSIYARLKTETLAITKSINLKHIADLLIKYSILITIVAYFIGTVLLLCRSRIIGIPFMPLAIHQLAVIDTYFLAIIATFVFCEYWVCELWCLIRRSGIKIIWKIVIRLIVTFVAIFVVCGISILLGILMDNVSGSLVIGCLVFLFLPAFCHLFMIRISLEETLFLEGVLLVLFACLVVYNIPLNVGGLAPQHVKYCDDSNLCQDYDYFGNYDGMLVLRDDDAVFLEPIGKGTIKY